MKYLIVKLIGVLILVSCAVKPQKPINEPLEALVNGHLNHISYLLVNEPKIDFKEIKAGYKYYDSENCEDKNEHVNPALKEYFRQMTMNICQPSKIHLEYGSNFVYEGGDYLSAWAYDEFMMRIGNSLTNESSARQIELVIHYMLYPAMSHVITEYEPAKIDQAWNHALDVVFNKGNLKYIILSGRKMKNSWLGILPSFYKRAKDYMDNSSEKKVGIILAKFLNNEKLNSEDLNFVNMGRSER